MVQSVLDCSFSVMLLFLLVISLAAGFVWSFLKLTRRDSGAAIVRQPWEG